MNEPYRAVEEFDLTESTFEVEEGSGRMMGNVRLIKAGLSKNRRNYPPNVIKESSDKGIWNDVRMFRDHSKTPPLKRPMSEMVAAIESTTYDEKEQSVEARIQYFDKDFFEFAKQAKNHMGDSINALVRGTRVREGTGQVTEQISQIVQPHSVDFVIYPSAGGMIHSFEGESDMIDWAAIKADELKANAPDIYEQIRSEAVAELEKPPQKDPPPAAPPVDVKAEITSALEAYKREEAEKAQKSHAVQLKVNEAFKNSGLPEVTRRRVMSTFEGQTEFDEKIVNEAITEAKEELAAAGAGPRITGQGPSGPGTESSSTTTFSAHESVAAAFGIKKEAAKTGDKK